MMKCKEQTQTSENPDKNRSKVWEAKDEEEEKNIKGRLTWPEFMWRRAEEGESLFKYGRTERILPTEIRGVKKNKLDSSLA